LAAFMCGQIVGTMSPRAITKPEIDQVGEGLIEVARDILAELWDDCTQETQGDLIDLTSNRNHGNDISARRREILLARGYLKHEGGSFHENCRLILEICGLE
jgi:hypothetical protein